MCPEIDQKYPYFMELLLEKQKSLLQDEASNQDAADVVELDQSKVGRLSRMDAMQMQAMAKATEERRKIELMKIESALQRIENQEYGFCIACGEEIAEKRLQIDPATLHCINCAK